MNTECWENGFFEGSLEGVEVLPAAFDAVEREGSTLVVQRHLKFGWMGLFFCKHDITGRVARGEFAVFPLESPGHGVVTETAVVTAARDALVADAHGPHAVGPNFYHPDVLIAGEALVAENLRRSHETLRVVHVGLLVRGEPDRAQISGQIQVGVGGADVEGELLGVKKDVECVDEPGHF